MLSALVMVYSAVDSITSVLLFTLCGLIILVAPAVVSMDILIIVGHLFPNCLLFFLVNSSDGTLRKAVV